MFGKETLTDPEPMGLKRLTDEAARELYPAVTDEWADLLPTDEGEVAAIRPLLAQTSLQDKPLRLAYDAQRDGWTAAAFHAAVDTFGAAVVIGQTTRGAVIGGYNPRGWIGLGEDRDSNGAFLFSWPDGDTAARPQKLPKVGGAALAVIDKAECGPQFGPDGLRIPLQPGDAQRVFCKLGSYYARRPDGSKTLFADGDETRRGKGAELQWLRAYVAEGGPEQYELDGIIWKSSQ